MSQCWPRRQWMGPWSTAKGIHIGYRAWLKQDTTPAYWFGHGLGYTDIAVTDVQAPGEVGRTSLPC